MVAINFKTFSDVLAKRQGEVYLKPGKVYKRILTREEVIDIFGEVPNYTVRYSLSISINKLNDERYEVVLKRGR